MSIMLIHTLKRPYLLASFFVSLAALSLSGCATDDIVTGDTTHVETHATDRYPITLVKGPQTIEIATHGGRLDAGQINAVKAFIHQATQAGVTPMNVSRPSGGGASRRVASEVASLMMEQGVPRSRVRFTTYHAPGSAPVRISYISSYAQTKPCGDWSEDLTDTSQNTSYANLGCAVQANIAAEIANPETVVVPNAPDMKNSSADVGAVNRSLATVNQVTLPSNYNYAP